MIPALITAGATLVGAHMRNREARAASARQMAFQERMSSSSYQRGMADMRKAGLNPILAGKWGGASTPAGSTYDPKNIGAEAAQAALTGAQIETALATAKERSAIAGMKQMDFDYFKSRGIPPVMAEKTGLNLATSELWDIIKKIPKDVHSKILQGANSATDYWNAIKAYRRRQPGPDSVMGGNKKGGGDKNLLNILIDRPKSYYK